MNHVMARRAGYVEADTFHPLYRKLVIIGDGACGKTSLLSVFTLGYFPTVSEKQYCLQDPENGRTLICHSIT